MPFTRKCLALYIIGFLLLLALLYDGARTAHRLWGLSGEHYNPGSSDFSQYVPIKTLSPKDFPLHDPNRRVIIVGDIHGKIKPFKKLLRKVEYDHHRDVLIHTGDILVRGSHKGSMLTIKYMAGHNITGVRGNHDQKIIEWKGWMNWINQIPGGHTWLSRLYSKWLLAQERGQTLEEWVDIRRKHSNGEDAKWWRSIPQDWIPFGDHYGVASDLTDQEYTYLLSLPLKLHIPSAHTFIIHAGLLPFDVRYDFDDKKRQPLAKIPTLSKSNSNRNDSNLVGKKVEALRQRQEEDILQKIPQNRDPWANLNLRSVLENKELSRKSSEGTFWNYFWNNQMSMCKGFDVVESSDSDTEGKKKVLPCYPTSVIYGHTASLGLDIKRWSFGLDTGCTYGRQLTAMILGPNPLGKVSISDWEIEDNEEEELKFDVDTYDDMDDTDRFLEQSTDSGLLLPDEVEDITITDDSSNVKKKKAKLVKFGEGSKAAIVHVKC